MGELRCDQITAAYGRDAVLSGVDLVVPDGTTTVEQYKKGFDEWLKNFK